MNLDQFITKYLGKKVDFDSYAAGQCVDLYRQYVQDVLGFPQSPSVRGAADIWETYLRDYFERITNTPKGLPQKGDIVIWNKEAGGGYGHVAIFLEGTVNQFISLDQNWPTLSEVTKTKHSYQNVLGWLRVKQTQSQEENMSQLLDFLGMPDEQSAITRLSEHLGSDGKKCEWGSEDGDRGGELGKARRRIKQLEQQGSSQPTTGLHKHEVINDELKGHATGFSKDDQGHVTVAYALD